LYIRLAPESSWSKQEVPSLRRILRATTITQANPISQGPCSCMRHKEKTKGNRGRGGVVHSPCCRKRCWQSASSHRIDQPIVPSYHIKAFQASRVRDAFIASGIEQGVCRTLISLFLPPLTTKPLKPGKGRIWKLEGEESYS
jgi:hypothetical protein